MGGTVLIAAVKYVCVLGRGKGRSVGVGVIAWVGVGVIAWARECVGGTVLIAAVKYVCVSGGVGVGLCVIVWVSACDCVWV